MHRFKKGDKVKAYTGVVGEVVSVLRTTVHGESGVDVYVLWNNHDPEDNEPSGPYDPEELIQA